MAAKNLLGALRYWRANLQLERVRISICLRYRDAWVETRTDRASANKRQSICYLRVMRLLHDRLQVYNTMFTYIITLYISNLQSFLNWGFPQTNLSTSFSSFSPSMSLILSPLINVIEGVNIPTRFWYAIYAGYLGHEILSVKSVEDMNKAESASAGSRWPRYGRREMLWLPRKSRWRSGYALEMRSGSSYNQGKLGGGEGEWIGMRVIIHCKINC